MKYSIIEISGGIGKNIMATAVISAIKQQHPDRDILVVTAFPEVFLYNEDVYRVFKFGACPYFYNDYVKNHDCMFFCSEPYRANGYLNESEHLVQSWCEAVNVEFKGTKGILRLNQLEAENARARVSSNKPILLYQPFGGLGNDHQYTWNRDIPPHQAQQIADILQQKYHIVQVVQNKQIKLNGCEHIFIPLRDLFALTLHCSGIIGIDSCVQHIANALSMPATVAWIATSPTVFGYDTHTNILPDPDIYISDDLQQIDGYFHEYDFSGSRSYDYPFLTKDILNVDEIVESYM